MDTDDQSPRSQDDRTGSEHEAARPADGVVTGRDGELEEAWREAESGPGGATLEREPRQAGR